MQTPLSPILQKLFSSSAEDAIRKILEVYGTNGYAIVNFLYFANIVFNRLDEDDKEEIHLQYESALIGSDLLLPDGVALELLARRRLGKKLANLNGTDFLPLFLSELVGKYKVRIFLYGGYEHDVQNAAIFLRDTYDAEVSVVQNGYDAFDWDRVASVVQPDDDRINVLLVGRGSPRQELWIDEHREQIRQYNCIAFGVGGLLDFWGWAEKRAPEWVRAIRGEWVYRVLTDPRKNLRKTLVSLWLFWYLVR